MVGHLLPPWVSLMWRARTSSGSCPEREMGVPRCRGRWAHSLVRERIEFLLPALQFGLPLVRDAGVDDLGGVASQVGRRDRVAVVVGDGDDLAAVALHEGTFPFGVMPMMSPSLWAEAAMRLSRTPG